MSIRKSFLLNEMKVQASDPPAAPTRRWFDPDSAVDVGYVPRSRPDPLPDIAFATGIP
jgi:hypothetical protein